MKNIFFRNGMLMALLAMASAMTSCKKLIEIPPNPPTAITATEQFSDSATAMTAIANIYSYQENNNGFMFDDGLLSLCSGLSSDELGVTTGNQAELQFYEYGVDRFNDDIAILWGDPYRALYPINDALARIAASNGLSASFKTQLTGELEVVRSLYNFYLVNLFGPVPLVTSNDYMVTSKLGRTSVDSVYIQMVTDLNAAQHVLPTAYPSPGSYRPNLYVAKALLAKVYLYRQNWQGAYNASDSIIHSGMYSLEPNLNNVFLDNSQEAIWQIPANGVAPYGTVTKEAENYLPPTYPTTTPRYPLTSFLLNAFETGDQRMKSWIDSSVINSGSGNQTIYYPYKYKNLYIYSSPNTEDFMILRLGEQYLIHAEAAVELGQLGTALSDLNMVRARAGLPASTAATKSDLLTAIMHERQVELFTEWGNRWLDLIRTGAASAVLTAEKGAAFKATDTLYPLPNAQLLTNTLLTQNPGYN